VNKVFVNIGLSLDGYMAPEGVTVEHRDDLGYKDWGALMGWAFVGSPGRNDVRRRQTRFDLHDGLPRFESRASSRALVPRTGATYESKMWSSRNETHERTDL
jgi:hypothetical protein